MLLSEYDIVFKAQKAIRGNVIADQLAYQPLDDYQPIKFDFPDEEVMYLKSTDCEEPLISEGPDPNSKWGLVFDGAVNAYGKGIGAVIVPHSVYTATALCNALVDILLFLVDLICFMYFI